MARAPHAEHALEAWATWLRVERNLAPRTRKAYVYDLTRFLEWMHANTGKDRVPLDTITREHLLAYLAFLKDDGGCKPATLGRMTASLRGFFAFCLEEKHLDVSPANDLQRPRLPGRLPVYLVREELERLLDVPDRSTPLGRRDHAILVLLAFGGLRLQELVGLDTNDLDFSRGTIRVFGKGRKERLVPMSGSVRATLTTMLEDEERRVADGERALFVNRHGRRLSGRAVQYLVERTVERAAISRPGVSPHKLRHTFATMLYGNEIELVDIQALLGHASLSSTQIYTHTDASRLQSAIDRLPAPE